MTPTFPFHLTWTDAGAVAIIFYIVVKLLREVRAFLEIRNGKKQPEQCKKGLSEHCRKCHKLLEDVRDFQKSLEKYLPLAVKEAVNKMLVNQDSIVKYQKETIANQVKAINDLVLRDSYNVTRYEGIQRTLHNIVEEAKKHSNSVAINAEILRLIQEHNLKSAKVIDVIMREKEIS